MSASTPAEALVDLAIGAALASIPGLDETSRDLLREGARLASRFLVELMTPEAIEATVSARAKATAVVDWGDGAT